VYLGWGETVDEYVEPEVGLDENEVSIEALQALCAAHLQGA